MIRRARVASKQDTVNPMKSKKRYERIRAKYERKIDRLSPRIKQLTARRAELSGEGATKG